MTGVLPSLRQEKTDPRSENRVVGSPRSSAACAGSILSEPVELRQENGSIGTATVSGVWCWLAKDPILFGGGQANLYLYCHVDPVNRIDPFGLGDNVDWSEVGRGLSGMAGGGLAVVLGLGFIVSDGAFPLLDAFGAGIATVGIADITLNYGVVVAALTGAESGEIPSGIVDPVVDAITGSDEAGDTAQEIYDAAQEALGQ